MVVERLAVTYNDRMSFALCDDLGIKKLTFADVVQEEAIDMEAEDAVARFDADFAIMLGDLRALVNDLKEVFQVKEIREA
jgi:recombination associated protein RdgC